MKISSDSDSWKASGILRRDFRHTHDEPEEMPHRKKGGNKNKQFCRRKPGLEHEYTERVVNQYTRVRFIHFCCRRCGKRDHSRYMYQYLREQTINGVTREIWT